VMADGLPLIVWQHDAEGNLEFVNQTFCEYFGVRREEMREGRWQALTHPDDVQAYANEFMACVRERRSFHQEVRVCREDGQWRWMESWARPRLSQEGAYLGHIGTSADVTEHKRAEEALREQDKRKDEFLATLAHELRNPLAPIRTGLEVMKLAKSDAALMESTRQMMQRQTEQLIYSRQ
jgi:PAS domain S-box-containing protein